MNKISSRSLVDFLRKKSKGTSLVDHLKIVYRPLICPFDDLLSLIDHKKKIFDIGCGNGQFCLLLAEHNAPKKICGIDICPEILDNARELLREYCEIEFALYDGYLLPNSIDQYDTITLIDVLHHIPRNRQLPFIKQIYHKMAVGAKLLIKDIDGSSPWVFGNKIHDLLLAGQSSREIAANKWKQYLQKTGFEILHESDRRMYWYPHFTLMAQKN